MKVEFTNPLTDPEWERQGECHADFSFFHGAAWARVLCKTYGHQPVYLRCTEAHELTALVPMMEVRSLVTGRRGVGLPFTDFSPPLFFSENAADAVGEKLKALSRERKWKHFELRGAGALENSATSAVEYYGHSLDLRVGVDGLRKNCSSAVRRAIEKASRCDLLVEVLRTRQAMHDFYELHGRTRQRHGLPPQPASFFHHIYDEVIAKDLGFVVLARHGGVPVAAAMFFHQQGGAIYKFGASDQKFQDLRGNNLVMWEGVKYLAEQGFHSLHFGRTSLANEGLRRVKLGWGTAEDLIRYYQFNVRSGTWVTTRDKVAGLHNVFFRNLPSPLRRLAGRLIYPHLD